MEIRSLCAFAALVGGCVVETEPPSCRDPRSVVFMAEYVESDCRDFVRPDLESCYQAGGRFDPGSCIVSAEYFCTDGVRAVVLFSFCSGELASGFETYRRAGDGCRLERAMVEAVE